MVDKHCAKAGVAPRRGAVINLLDTQIAMVEADEGIAIIPSFGLPACRNREVVMMRLTNPVVHLKFYQVGNRSQKLPRGADEFTAFLNGYIARRVGRARVM
jgi:DNA-binding transcriptional LysR family regulator